ncbi:MAG: DUF2029 domain-containing protein [Acidobacteriia bacterium]|nr:DUF2029 domain-containing protein [Terriglobia bacterium]
MAYLRRKAPALAVVFVCAVGLAWNFSIAVFGAHAWGADYNQFSAASRLAGTGHLYDWDALRKIEAENGAYEVPTGRLPVVLYSHKLLGNFPYAVARSIWTACGIAALIVFAMTWPGAGRPLMMMALAWSLPATLVVLYGQDVPFWVMFFAAGLLLIGRKKPWSAGIALSLCICKFHLALGIPVMLAAQRRWKTLIAGALAVSVLIACCFLIEGPGWLAGYAKMSHLPAIAPPPERAPNLYGLASWLPWASAAEVVAGAAIAVLLWAACRGIGEVGLAGAAAAAGGLLLSHHAYAGDCTLLIPLSVLTAQRQGAPGWLRLWAVLMLTPASVLLLLSQKPWLGQVLIAGFVATAVWFARSKPLSRPAHS